MTVTLAGTTSEMVMAGPPTEYHSDSTLGKVRDILLNNGMDSEQAEKTITDALNAGLLFREFAGDITPNHVRSELGFRPLPQFTENGLIESLELKVKLKEVVPSAGSQV